jgi:hypothetical protein
MATAASVLVCALELLSGSVGPLAPIHLVDTLPIEANVGVEGFVRLDPPAIFLVTTTPEFRAAAAARYRCGHRMALRKIASIIVHEQWHVTNGPDESGAYQAQLMALIRLNAGPHTPVYAGVARSMRHVLDIQRRLAMARDRGQPSGPPPRTTPAVLSARVDVADGRE